MKKYDLKERTTKFAQRIIKIAKRIPENVMTKSLISQMVRAGTSVGANYCEADNAESKKDFNHKIFLCKKEVCETKYWLLIISETFPQLQEETKNCITEAHELTLIFHSILQKTNISH